MRVKASLNKKCYKDTSCSEKPLGERVKKEREYEREKTKREGEAREGGGESGGRGRERKNGREGEDPIILPLPARNHFSLRDVDQCSDLAAWFLLEVRDGSTATWSCPVPPVDPRGGVLARESDSGDPGGSGSAPGSPGPGRVRAR